MYITIFDGTKYLWSEKFVGGNIDGQQIGTLVIVVLLEGKFLTNCHNYGIIILSVFRTLLKCVFSIN